MAIAAVLILLFYSLQKSHGATQITVPECGLTRYRTQSTSPNLSNPNNPSDLKALINAHPGEFPWYADIWFNGNRGHCGGAIINKYWVLTAAHCVTHTEDDGWWSHRPDQFQVVLDVLYLSNEINKPIHDIDAIYPYSEYNPKGTPQGTHDIALIKTKIPIDINYNRGGNVNGVCLPPENANYDKKIGVLQGWNHGRTDILQWGENYLDWTNYNCNTSEYPYVFLANTFGKDLTRGDSGGPFIVYPQGTNGPGVVYGTLSGSVGVNCAWYMNVAQADHLRWIKRTVAIQV